LVKGQLAERSIKRKALKISGFLVPFAILERKTTDLTYF
jgi:hypothetical protein